jgi:transposase
MNPTSELKEILNKSFTWHKSRLDCFARILLALISVRTVNLREIAVAFKSKANIDSRYRRLKRFFAGFKIDSDVLAKWIFNLFFSDKKKVYLSIDRTNWFLGKSKINILVLGVTYEGIAIPLFWKMLDGAGNATSEEHVEIIKRFVKIFGKDCIAGILGDREFMSEDLFRWFKSEKIPFYIRIKSNTQVRYFYEKTIDVKKLFKRLKRGKQMFQLQPVYIFGIKLLVAAGKNEKDELLIVATNQPPQNAVSIYLRRWEIETLFQSLKGRGFRFEDTHLTKQERIDTLMSVLVIGFCWMHRVGEWHAKKKAIRLNRHRNTLRPQYSYFRYGYDFVRDVVLHISRKIKQFRSCLSKLVPPKMINLHKFGVKL